MKDGEYAIYLGKEYTSGKTKDGRLVLRSTDIIDVENGFEICKPFKYRWDLNDTVCLKFVNRNEVSDYYYLRTYALYKDYKFYVLDKNDYKILIVATSGDPQNWIKLGMTVLEKCIYGIWISKDEAEIIIEREDVV